MRSLGGETVRIGVLAGGSSSEREISLRSGRNVYDALVREGMDAIFLDVQDNIYDIISKNKIDIAFIALHGRFGEDGTIQKILEDAGIPYTGSSPGSSSIAFDKIAAKRIFREKGIPTPKHIILEKGRSCPKITLPVVVKPQLEGSSIGLSVVKDRDHLSKALEEAFKYGTKVLAEEYINGRELTVGILDDKPLPVIEIVTANNVYDYEAKYKDPETKYLVPAPIDEKSTALAKELGQRAHAALGCRSFSRVDIMMDAGGNMFVLEVNTIPGMTERSLLPKAANAVGIDYGALCIKIIENVLERMKDETTEKIR